MSEVVSKFSNRLPEYVIPEVYKLNLDIDGSNTSYKGEIRINIKIEKRTKTIVLHGAELTINKSFVIVKDDKHVSTTSISQNKETNFITITYETELEIGHGILVIDFENKITKSMRGFYLTTYDDDNGVTHEGLVTNFEPDDASRAIPCFDEPNFKAIFEVTIKYLKNKTVLSNSPLLSTTEIDDKYSSYVFDKTPKMSTYLLAFAMGDFGAVSKLNSAGIKLSVYAPVHKVKFCDAALEACEKFLDFYTNYFNIPYPLSKLDLISIPDISVGAMENWGLITFREDLLLVDPAKTSNHTLKDVYLVIAHEIAHQWFGNLVTMKWWTDLWLNEGFANFIEFEAVNACYPDLLVWKTFYTTVYSSALELDSFISSHPIEVEDTHPAELDEIFDHITYCKGASVIRQMQILAGRENFRKGLSDYLRTFQYQNVTTKDLWSFIEKSSSQPISEFMTLYTKQVGYPFLEIKKSQIQSEFTINQNRFLLDKKSADQKWLVPCNISIFASKKEILEKSFKNSSINVTITEDYKYFIVDENRSFLFRVLYPSDNFRRILEHYKEIPSNNKIGLVSDYYAFSRGGYISTADYLDLVSVIANHRETDEEVWDLIIKSLNDIFSLMFYSKHPTCLDLIKKFAVTKVLPVLELYKVSYDNIVNKSPLTLKLVSNLLSFLCKYHESTRIMLTGWFDKFIKDEIKVIPDFKICMYRACFLSKEYAKKALIHFDKLSLTEEKVDLILGMASSVDKELIRELYEFSMKENVKSQDGRFIFSALAQSPFAHEIGWDYITKNSKEIKEKYPVPFFINRMFGTTASGFATSERYEKCGEFFKNCPDVKMNQCFEQALENIRIRIKWLEKDQDAIFQWFQKAV